jgi:hypothetical protein
MYMANFSHLPPADDAVAVEQRQSTIYELAFLPEADREDIETGPRYTVGPAPGPLSVFVAIAAWYDDLMLVGEGVVWG